MSLKFFDGFDAYATAQITLRGYTLNNGGVISIAAAGRNGGNCLRFGDSSDCTRVFGGTASTIFTGFAFRRTAFNGFSLALLNENGVATHLSMFVDTTGHIAIYRGNGSTLLATSTNTMLTSTYYYIQWKAVIHDTTGSIEVLVNGVSWISVTGIDTRNGGTGFVDAMLIHCQNSSQQDIDDWWICDSAGAVNNTYLGDVRAEVILPTGAGAHTDWTPSTGSNWQNVDDASPNGDTDYNSSATAAQQDTFATANLATASGTVAAVQHLTYSRKDDAGARTARPVSRIGGTDYPATTFSVLDTYAYNAQIEEVSPATAAAWTIAEINGAEFGYELVS